MIIITTGFVATSKNIKLVHFSACTVRARKTRAQISLDLRSRPIRIGNRKKTLYARTEVILK